MTIIDPVLSSETVQKFIESVPEIKEFVNKEMDCQKKGIEVLKSYTRLSQNYINMVRGFVLATILLLLDIVLFDMQYSVTLIAIMVVSFIFIVSYRTYKHYMKKKLAQNYTQALKEFGEVKNANTYVQLLELEDLYKSYEEIKEMEKVGEITFATKESEGTIFIKNKNETKSFTFGKLFSQIVTGRELVFKVLDDEFMRLKNSLVEN